MSLYNKIYVGHIPEQAKKEELAGLLERFGEIQEFYYTEGSDHAYVSYTHDNGIQVVI